MPMPQSMDQMYHRYEGVVTFRACEWQHTVCVTITASSISMLACEMALVCCTTRTHAGPHGNSGLAER
jgi:hypothetical protein